MAERRNAVRPWRDGAKVNWDSINDELESVVKDFRDPKFYSLRTVVEILSAQDSQGLVDEVRAAPPRWRARARRLRLLQPPLPTPPPLPRCAAAAQLKEQQQRLDSLVDTVVQGYHSGFARSIQNYSQILHLFTEAKEQVGRWGAGAAAALAGWQLRAACAPAARPSPPCLLPHHAGGLSQKVSHRRQQAAERAVAPAAAAGAPPPPAASSSSPAPGPPPAPRPRARPCLTRLPYPPAFDPRAQYQKSVTLASSISLLDDIQLVVDTPAKIEAALAAQVSLRRLPAPAACLPGQRRCLAAAGVGRRRCRRWTRRQRWSRGRAAGCAVRAQAANKYGTCTRLCQARPAWGPARAGGPGEPVTLPACLPACLPARRTGRWR
jgi:hypothetical protein